MSKAILIREITIGETRELARILAGLDEFQASPRIRKTFVDVNFPSVKLLWMLISLNLKNGQESLTLSEVAGLLPSVLLEN